MTLVEFVGPKNKKPIQRITLEKTRLSPPEYLIEFSYFQRGGEFQHYYSALKIDGFFVLTYGRNSFPNEFERNYKALQKILGVSSKEKKADQRLRELAREEFEKIKNEHKNPSESIIEFNKKLNGGKYTPYSIEFIELLSQRRKNDRK